MVCEQEKLKLLDEFSEYIQRHFSETVWHSLFIARDGRAQFGSAVRTLLCVECPTSGPLTRDGLVAALDRRAPAHGGCVDPCSEDHAIVSFRDPLAALHMAVEVQRNMPRARLRMGLATGRCRIAVCRAAGNDFQVLLGSERARVEELTRRAGPGTLQLAPETYEVLEGPIGHELGSCVLTAEFDGDVVTEVSLALPPDQSAHLSTFAGLGLT